MKTCQNVFRKSKINNCFLMVYLLLWKNITLNMFLFNFSKTISRQKCVLVVLWCVIWSQVQCMALQSNTGTIQHQKQTTSLIYTSTLLKINYLGPGHEIASRHEMPHCLIKNFKPFTRGIQGKNYFWTGWNHWLTTADICRSGDALKFLAYEV